MCKPNHWTARRFILVGLSSPNESEAQVYHPQAAPRFLRPRIDLSNGLDGMATQQEITRTAWLTGLLSLWRLAGWRRVASQDLGGVIRCTIAREPGTTLAWGLWGLLGPLLGPPWNCGLRWQF